MIIRERFPKFVEIDREILVFDNEDEFLKSGFLENWFNIIEVKKIKIKKVIDTEGFETDYYDIVLYDSENEYHLAVIPGYTLKFVEELVTLENILNKKRNEYYL